MDATIIGPRDCLIVIVKPTLVDGSDLFEQDSGAADQTFDIYSDMSREMCIWFSARNWRHDGGRAESVARIILQDENRTETILLTSYYW